MNPETTVSIPWYRNPALIHGLETGLSFLAGLASLGVGGRVVQIAGKAAVAILAETVPIVEPPSRLDSTAPAT